MQTAKHAAVIACPKPARRKREKSNGVIFNQSDGRLLSLIIGRRILRDVYMLKNKDDFNTMMISLMNEINAYNPYSSEDIIFSDKAKDLIHEMAEYARNNKYYQKILATETGMNEHNLYVEAAKEKTVSRVYYDMLYKIVEAPTFIHLEFTPMMLIPIIDDMLQCENQGD
jgi:hypothetical protein